MPTPKVVKPLKEQLSKSKMLDALPDELVDIFPALKNYRQSHTLNGFKKLCAEIEEFCLQVYASTQNNAEREIYNNMIVNLKK